MQGVETAPQSLLRSFAPAVVLFTLAVLVAISTTAVGPLALLPVFGVLFFALIVAHPEYGIALFLSTFLMTYPASLQGGGSLTINNVLGAVFLVLLALKLYRDEDWWFLYNRELQLLALIVLIYYISGRFNGPDPDRVALMGVQTSNAANLKTFVTRCLFVLFFVNFIRTPAHVRMIYLLAIGFMVVTAIAGLQSVFHGEALHGYRATSEQAGIAAANNPNRLAMFSILAIAGLWYIMRSVRLPGLRYLIIPTVVVLALCVFLTASRSGLLGLGICCAAIMLDEGFNFRTLFSFGLAVLLLLTVAIQFVPEKSLERITNLPGSSDSTDLGSSSLERRQYGWIIGLELFEEHPILGIGMGNWELARFLADPTHSTAAPHSSYILALIEGGSVCLLVFLWLLWCTWQNLRWAESYMADPRFPMSDITWIVKGAKASFLVLIFFSLFADLWQMVIIFWLVALSVVIRRLVEHTLAVEQAMAMQQAAAF